MTAHPAPEILEAVISPLKGWHGMKDKANERLLGIDLGTVRTGFAVSDPGGFLASPIETVTERDLTRLADRAFSIAAGQGTARVVLGHPRNMDGSRGESARRAEEFAALLTERGLEVILWDERMSTVASERVLMEGNVRREDRKTYIDKMAAAFILQGYLDYQSFSTQQKESED